jgi:hypothetical protein
MLSSSLSHKADDLESLHSVAVNEAKKQHSTLLFSTPAVIVA